MTVTPSNGSVGRFEAVVAGLLQPSAYPHDVESVRRIDTHISVVLLTGRYAYKLKKPLKLPFLDFSTLARRRALCLREVELNRRTAPSLYLDVQPIAETAGAIRIGGGDDPVDYAVRMRQFPDADRLDHVLERGALSVTMARQLADDVATFHGRAQVAPSPSEWGTPAEVEADVIGNFDLLRQHREAGAISSARLASLQRAQLAEIRDLSDVLRERQRNGRVRDCHGDLHLSNIALIDGRAVPFDCIEFNDAFRWIDVMSDLAFLLMDLDHRNANRLATAVLNRYLERSGDYAGLRTLCLYQGYRALVRAKVGALQLAQGGAPACDTQAGLREIDAYITLAEHYATPKVGAKRPVLLITCGLSGSGKSWLAEQLAARTGAIVVRSDVERRRLFDVDSTDTAARYSETATAATYERVGECALAALDAGLDAIADAAFLRREQREQFAALAGAAGYGFAVLHTTAPVETLRERLVARSLVGKDPSEADLEVLGQQLRSAELPQHAEAGSTLEVDTGADVDIEGVASWLGRCRTAPT